MSATPRLAPCESTPPSAAPRCLCWLRRLPLGKLLPLGGLLLIALLIVLVLLVSPYEPN